MAKKEITPEVKMVGDLNGSIFKNTLITKKELTSKIESFIEEIKDDGHDMKVILAKVARNKEFWDVLDKQIRPLAFDQIPEGEKETMVEGIKISKSSSTKYDYSNDPSWCALDEQIKELTEKRKNIEEILKLRKKKTMELDEESGELIEIGFAIKYSTDTLKLSW